MFNPEEFMNTQQEAEEFDTRRSLVPPGEYTAVLDRIEARTVGEDNKPILSCGYKIINSDVEGANDRLVFDTVWLDMDANGNLMRGPDKNLKLGQILEAVGLNGKPWSPPMLQGQVVMVHVSSRMNKRSNEEENSISRIVKAE